MSDWYNIDNRIIRQKIADISTTQYHEMGTRVRCQDRDSSTDYGVGEFIYLLGVASTAAGDAVTYNADDFSTTRLVADAIGPVALAMGANVASSYGWYQIFGKGEVTAGTVADNGNVYATSTAGTVDDAIVAGDRVKRAKFASADGTPSAGLAEIEIDFPYVDDGLAA